MTNPRLNTNHCLFVRPMIAEPKDSASLKQNPLTATVGQIKRKLAKNSNSPIPTKCLKIQLRCKRMTPEERKREFYNSLVRYVPGTGKQTQSSISSGSVGGYLVLKYVK